MSLQVITVPPSKSQKPSGLIVALHGWGANAQTLASVAPLLNLPDYQFMFPDAPFPHPYSSVGKAWYDLAYNKGQGLPESRKLLTDWLRSLEGSTGIPLSRTILSGFSQGAAMSLDVGLSLPLAGVIALSGYLHPLNQSVNRDSPPVLILHGRQDSVVPLKAAQSARDSLTTLGVSVQYQEYDMGHEIRPEVLLEIRKFVLGVMSSQKVY